MKSPLNLVLVVVLLIVTLFWPVLFGFGLVVGIVRSLSSLPTNEDQSLDLVHVRGEKGSDNWLVTLPLSGILLDESNDPFGVLSGVTSADWFTRQLWKLGEDSRVKAIIIEIDSPGGTVTASEWLSAELVRFQNSHPQIPIYVYGRGLMASGAYWVATTSTSIWAQPGAMVGSIGVIGPQFPVFEEVTEYNQGLFGPGISARQPMRFFSITAGKGKDFGSPFADPTAEALSRAQDTVDAAYLRFVDQIAMTRNITASELTDRVGAYVYDASQAASLRLIDKVGFRWQLEGEIASKLELGSYSVRKVETSMGFLEGLWLRTRATQDCRPSSQLLALWGDPSLVCE